MTANNSVLSTSAIYFISNLISSITTFTLIPILTRHLTPSEYGHIAIFQTFLSGLTVIASLSVQGAASIKYYEERNSKSELKYYIGNCIATLTIFSFLIAIIFLAFKSNFLQLISLKLELVIASIITSCAATITSIRMTQWQIRKKATAYGAFQISESIITTALSLTLVLYFMNGAAGRIWSLIFTPILFSFLSLIFLYKDDLLGFSWRSCDFREILNFGVPLIPHSVGLFMLSSIDRLVIESKLGLSQVGFYVVAVQLVAVMGLMLDSINNAYVPWLFEKLKRDNITEKRQIVRYTYIYCFILLLIAALSFLIGPIILQLMIGEQYEIAGELVGWLALGQAFNGMYLMVTNYIFFSRRTGLLSLATITSGIVNFSLLLTLTSLFGLKGAAISFATSMAFKFLLTWFIANLRHPMPWFNFSEST